MQISWGLVPRGEHGVLPPGGNPNVFEEAHILPLRKGGFWTVGRTSQGYLGAGPYTPIYMGSSYTRFTPRVADGIARLGSSTGSSLWFNHGWHWLITSTDPTVLAWPYSNTAQTADPTAGGGWCTTGFATYWDPLQAPAKIVPMPERAIPAKPEQSAPLQPGTGLKSPRGPLEPKRMSNGMYLLLYYNNMGRDGEGRNPYWLAAGGRKLQLVSAAMSVY